MPNMTVCTEAKADVGIMNYRETYEKYMNHENLTVDEM